MTWMKCSTVCLCLLLAAVFLQVQDVQGLSLQRSLQTVQRLHQVKHTMPSNAFPGMKTQQYHSLMQLHGTRDDSTSSSQSSEDSLLSKASAFLQKTTSTTWFAAAEVVVTFAFISGIDGAFSGDWSKYGLITKEVEDLLRFVMTIALSGHLLLAVIASQIAASRNQPAAPAFWKTALVGGLSFLHVLGQTDKTAIRMPTVEGFKRSVTSTFAGEYDEVAVNAKIDDFLQSAPIVMFSFTKCPYCLKAKQILRDELNIEVKAMELDIDRKEGNAIRNELAKRTGRTSVPSIWIRGDFIGGCNDGPKDLQKAKIVTEGGLVALVREGQLKKLLR